MLYDNPYISLASTVHLLKAQVIEVMLHGCMTWTIAPQKLGALREAHRGVPPEVAQQAYCTFNRRALDYHMLPYPEVLERGDCQCIEATVMTLSLLHAGHVVRTHDERLANIVMRGVRMFGRKTTAGRPAQHLSTQ